MYYLNSRFYDPEIGRFVNADTVELVLASQATLTDKNLYAYCDNNPIVRKDSNGEFWVWTLFAGAGKQYVGDIIANIAAGATGWEVFNFRSSLGEYIAAGVTEFLPGSGLASSLVGNIVSEVIFSIERDITGEGNDLKASIKTVLYNTLIDVGVTVVSNKLADIVTENTSKTYSQYANIAYNKNPNILSAKICARTQRLNRMGNSTAKGIRFAGKMAVCVLT